MSYSIDCVAVGWCLLSPLEFLVREQHLPQIIPTP